MYRMTTPILTMLVSLLFSAVSSERELIQTNMVYRHGDRAPVAVFPNDRYQADSWPDGLGMLTHKGREQQTRLGQFLRRRYGDFISHRFDSEEIYVRSSDADRCIMSVYSNLAGLYSNLTGLYGTNESALWNADFITWQPVPVHTVPSKQDEVLRMTKPCDALAAQLNGLMNDSNTEKLIRKDYAQFFQLMSNLTGYRLDEILNTKQHLYDPLFCESQHNMTWPLWADWRNVTCNDNKQIPCKNRTIYEILVDFNEFLYKEMANDTVLHKFIGGPLLIQMMDNFDKIVEYNKKKSEVEGEGGEIKKTPKFYMYSAHDSTVAALMSAMGVFDGHKPEYTATIIVELYKDGLHYEVEVYYKNITDSDEIYKLLIPGCQPNCSLARFRDKYEKLRIRNWDEACYNGHKALTQQEIITISVCITVVVCLAIAAVMCNTRRKRISHRYMKVNT